MYFYFWNSEKINAVQGYQHQCIIWNNILQTQYHINIRRQFTTIDTLLAPHVYPIFIGLLQTIKNKLMLKHKALLVYNLVYVNIQIKLPYHFLKYILEMRSKGSIHPYVKTKSFIESVACLSVCYVLMFEPLNHFWYRYRRDLDVGYFYHRSTSDMQARNPVAMQVIKNLYRRKSRICMIKLVMIAVPEERLKK